MLDEWIRMSLKFARVKGEFYSGARKILRGRSYTFEDIQDDLQLSHAGFTKTKLTMLKRLYYHDESMSAASPLWDRRRSQKKYGSVGFSTFAHLTKSNPDKKAKRASVMGPCMLGGSLTLLNNGSTSVDIFYRTTELFKKFPADLVFIRDELLPKFEIDEIESINFHFANITCHPMYFVTLIPSVPHPEATLDWLREHDEYFYNWVVKWTARYLCEEYSRGIQKFSQALRVRKDAMDRISSDVLPGLQDYLRTNHPGYRTSYDETICELEAGD